jgi:hypothetical protein
MFGADTMGSTAPTGVNQQKPRTTGSFGALTFGYRFSTGLAAEFQAETSDHQVAACPANGKGCESATVRANYQLRSSRVGPALRLMTGGRKGRFVGTIGLGAAVHTLTFDKEFSGLGPKDVSSVGSYILLAGAYELNLGHFLLDAGLRLVGESADENKTGGVKSAGSFGLELRVGYGQW